MINMTKVSTADAMANITLSVQVVHTSVTRLRWWMGRAVIVCGIKLLGAKANVRLLIE